MNEREARQFIGVMGSLLKWIRKVKMQAYLFDMKNVEYLCDRFEEEILNRFYTSGEPKKPSDDQYFYTPIFYQLFNPIEHVIDAYDVFNIKSITKNEDFIRERVYGLKDRSWPRDTFKMLVSDIKSAFSEAKEEIEHLCSMLDKTERDRINEAIHDFFEECYYSSVAMTVCAIESRLLKLMVSAKPSEEKKLEGMTLGQLIRDYIDNKEQYKSKIPEEHEHLLRLCNTYRILSVQPKEVEITKNKASAVLNLSIAFLTDEKTQAALGEEDE